MTNNAFQIDRGLAKFDYVDHHAILGVSIDANTSEIRKRYLKIARSLHPDSCTEVNKQLASQLLSKLVNPSYEKLTQDRERTEYDVLLRLLGQRIIQEKDTIELKSDLAQRLLRVRDSNNFYKNSVQNLAEKQYEFLDQVLDLTGELSELNLAYLVFKEGKGAVTVGSRKQPLAAKSSGSAQGATPPPASSVGTPRWSPTDRRSSPGQPGSGTPQSKGDALPAQTFVSQYYRRAEELLAKNNLQQAILELRDALKLDPNNSRCHGLIGTIYLRQNQTTMAKVHFNQALRLEPKNSMALTGKQQLDKLDQKGNSAQKPGGLFGLFGGKKK